MKTLILCAVLFLVSSCVVPQMVETPSSGAQDFTQFKRVSYVIRDTAETEYGSDRNYDKATLTLFDAMLGSKLRSMGFEVVDAKQAQFSIDVIVTAVKQGNAALRFFIGFGAGRAVLTYRAQFTDAAANTLGAFDGGRSHLGTEFGESFADADQIQAIAVSKSVQQIEEFIKNNGSLTEKVVGAQ